MTRKAGPAGSGEPRGRGAGDRTGPAEALEQLRSAILQRLDQLDALARDQADRLGQSPGDRERLLRERVATLEASHSRLQSELKRREQEWADLLHEIEDDRRLLTEAWERLERERIEAAQADAAPSARDRATPQVSAAGTRLVPEADDTVARAILWQFQALKDDVRNNANGKTNR